MKKLVLATSAILLGLGAFGLSHKAPVAVGADNNASDVASLLSEYVNGGQYTKLTTMFLTPAAQAETQYFHAGANALERATYYDEDVDALLMGNIDGSFDTINSGYIKEGDNMRHYHYNEGADPIAADFFDASKITKDYTVKNTSPNSYFVTLSQLATNAASEDWWLQADGSYELWIGSGWQWIDPEGSGDYSNLSLKNYQYFVAPMMLQNNYYTFARIRIYQGVGYLSIRLYADYEADAEKTIISDASSGLALISEARIYKGVALPEYVLTSEYTEVGESAEKRFVEYRAGMFEASFEYHAQYVMEKGDKVKFKTRNAAYGTFKEGCPSWRTSVSDYVITVNYAGTYDFWINLSEGIWLEYDGQKYDVTFTVTKEVESGNALYMVGDFNGWGSGIGSDSKMTEVETNKWSITVPQYEDVTIKFKFVVADANATSADGAVWESNPDREFKYANHITSYSAAWEGKGSITTRFTVAEASVASGKSVFICGTMNSWALSADYRLTEDGDVWFIDIVRDQDTEISFKFVIANADCSGGATWEDSIGDRSYTFQPWAPVYYATWDTAA